MILLISLCAHPFAPNGFAATAIPIPAGTPECPFPEEPGARFPAEALGEGLPDRTGYLPPKLARQIPVSAYFGCRRAFRWQEKTYLVDSYYKQDAGRLRPIMKDTPDALAALNRYQNNQAGARVAAYIGSIGLMLAVASLFVTSPDPTWVQVKNITLVSGLSMAGGAFIVNFGILRTNESNVREAVQHYNAAHPQTPVDLQFSTSVLF